MKRLLTFIVLCTFCVVFYLGVNCAYAQNSYEIGEIFSSKDLAGIELVKIDNDSVRERYVQTANEVDYVHGTSCDWLISDAIYICGNFYKVLYQDFHAGRYYYLVKEPKFDAYPQMVMICAESMGGDTMQFFEIDRNKHTLTVTDHQLLSRIKNTGSGSSCSSQSEYLVVTDVYLLSENLQLIDSSSCHKVLNDNEVIIQLY